MPRSTTRPSSITQMRSASRTVERRWAITIEVRPCSACVERRLHRGLVLAVEVARGLVEDHDGRVLQQHPRDRQALLLAARQAIAALADHGVVAVGQRGEGVVNAGGPAGGDQFLVGGARARVSQVRLHGLVEQVGILRDHADGGPKRGLGEIAHVVTVDADDAPRHVVQAWHQRGECRLAGARRADEGDHLARLDRQAHVVEHLAADRLFGAGRFERRHRGVGGIVERHVVDLDATARVFEVDGAGPVVDGDGRVEHLEDPLERHQGRHDVDAGVGQAGERCVDAGDVRRQREERADRDGLRDHQLGAEAVDRRGTERARRVRGRRTGCATTSPG